MAGEYIYLKDRSGQPARVKVSDWAKLKESGESVNYTASTEQEFARERHLAENESAGDQAIAAAEGAARGVSLGTSDAALGELLGDDYSDRARWRQEANPFASGASEVIGAVGGAIASGGTGAVARGGIRGLAALSPAALAARGAMGAGRLAGRGPLRRLAAEGLVEGTLGGAGHVVSEAALTNTELTAEKLLAGAGQGALWGGGAGLGLGSLASVARRSSGIADALGDLAEGASVPGFGSGSMREGAEELAGESFLKAIGMTKGHARALEKRGLREQLENAVRTAKLDDGTQIVAKFDSIEASAKKVLQHVDESSQKLAQFRKQVFAKIDGAGTGKRIDLIPSAESLVAKLEESVIVPLQQSDDIGKRAWGKRASAELKSLREAADSGEAWTLDRMTQLRKSWGDRAFTKLPQKLPEHSEPLREMVRVLEAEIEVATEKASLELGSGVAGQYKQLKTTTSNALKMKDLADDALAAGAGNRAVSLTDSIAGAAGLATGNPLLGIGTALGHKALRERGRSTVARIAERAAGMTDDIDKRITTHIKRAETKAAEKVKREAPQKAVRSKQEKSKRRPIVPASVAVFGDTKSERRVAYQKTVDEVRKMAGNPMFATAQLEKMTREISEESPQVATAVHVTAMRGARYLANAVPSDGTATNSLTPQLEKEFVSEADMAAFAEKVRTVRDPTTVLDSFENGTLTHGQVETIKAVNPQMYQEMRTIAQTALLEAKVKPRYQERLQISLLLDIDGDPSLTPAFLSALQQAPVANTQQPPPAPRKAPQLANSLMTGTDAAEARLGGMTP